MKNEKTSKEQSTLKSDILTGASSAAGAMAGMMAGSALASEVNAAEMPEKPSNHGSHSVNTNIGNASPDLGQGAGTLDTVPPVTSPDPEPVPPVTSPNPEPTPGPDPEPTPEPLPGDPDDIPEVVVMDYQTVTNDDGSQMDIAVVNVDEQEVYLIDENQDGSTDVLVADVNEDGNIDGNELLNIEDEDISMSTFQDEVMEDSDVLLADNDYVNDANVDEFMA